MGIGFPEAIVMVKAPDQRLTIPPLENGDRLTRYEFERRYNAMPNLKKAELIEGTVFIPRLYGTFSQAKSRAAFLGWAGQYAIATTKVSAGANVTIRLDLANEPQPDVVLLIEESSGGQARLSDDDYVEGAPELIVEIAASSVAIDLHVKKPAYRRNGVKEYIVWQVLDRRLDWFYLENGNYLTLAIDADGLLRSRVFPGLWLAVDDLLKGNMQRVLAALQDGVRSPEHAAFVQRLTNS